MPRGARWLALGLVALAVGPVAAPASAATPATTQRFAGADRFATAAALALDRYPSASDAVVARADDPADALAGSYVAGTHIGPVLLAEQHRVPSSTMDVLRRLGVFKVRVLGGTTALGPEVQAQLEAAGITVKRLSGSDRYATAAAVARDSGAANVGIRANDGATVILVNGLRPADALSAGPLAYGQQWPVLLTTAGVLPAATRSALDDLAIRHVIVVGGRAVVSDAVVADLRRGGRTVERVAGASREGTATALADLMLTVGRQVTKVEVSAAGSFADALALGPHAAPAAPVLLCHSRDDCGAATISWIAAHAAQVDTVVVAGGTTVLGAAAEAQLRAAAS